MQGFHFNKKTQAIAEVVGRDTEESGSDKGNYNNRTPSPYDQDLKEDSDSRNGPKPKKSLDLSLISKQSTKKSINSKMQLKTDGRNGEGFGGKNVQKSKTGGADNLNASNSNAGNRA